MVGISLVCFVIGVLVGVGLGRPRRRDEEG